MREVQPRSEHRNERAEKGLERLAGDDLVPVRDVRQRHAGKAGDGRAPRAAGDHDPVGHDAAAVGLHALHAAERHVDTGDARERLDLRAALSRAVGVAPEERPGKDDAVLRVPRRGDETAGVELRHDLARLAGRDHSRRQPEALLQFRAVLDAAHGLVVVREEEISTLAQPDVDAELLREMAHEIDRLFRQLDQQRRRPLRAHAAAIAPGRAFAEISALEDEDLPRTGAREVPRERQPHDPAADDDDVDSFRKRCRWL